MREKQIEEIAKFTCNSCEMGCGFTEDCCLDKDYKKCELSIETATAIYNAGYRKQREGEWEKRDFIIFDFVKTAYRCTSCGTTWDAPTKFCPNCGAKMKGAKNEQSKTD
ncbi:MAG: hypothetical protein U0M02_07140 [Acutalibacteraceae bacterium]|nr:hypothetical protein [Acutalibacteraceae bacterium]